MKTTSRKIYLENNSITTYKKKGAKGGRGITLLSVLIVDVCCLSFFDEEVETILQSNLI